MSAELAALRRSVNHDLTVTDEMAEHLERRVAALEEIVAARWPRGIRARVRLARQIRNSVAGFPGETFAERRANAASADWLAQS